jgi:small subunit ribosomal protein S5
MAEVVKSFTTQQDPQSNNQPVAENPTAPASSPFPQRRPGGGYAGAGRGARGGFGGPGRGPRDGRFNASRGPKPESSLKEKVLDLRRVTRVVAGGKRFKFRATIVVGDEKGNVGVGIGKGADVQQSVAKAKADAAKKMLTITLKGQRTIAHEVEAKYSAARVLIKPAAAGHGLRAGGAVRFVLAMAGIRDASAKVLGRTPNKLTNAMAALEALKKLQSKKPSAHIEIAK